MNPKNKTEKTNPISRPPVVAIMGHIDHGKSTLLDYIRKTNITEKEAGGITQHVSAYEAECDVGGEKRKMTFLDTPGHEAFCSVREHSARVADIAILIISAEDGVKPQTLEALGCINNDSMPFVVALNKIDKAGVNIDKIKQNLAENGILVEGWGGKIPSVSISAKTGEGVSELLEIVALQSDVEELYGDPFIPAEGFVIESDLNPKQGISATLVIKNGSLKIGMFAAADGAYAPVRSIENYRGENIKEAIFSSPIKIFGWSAIPKVGSRFAAFSEKEEAMKFASKNTGQKTEEEKTDILDGKTFLEVVIKADNFGSLEAVEYELQKLGNDKTAVRIISKDIGTITEKDIKTANIKKSLVLGFNVGTDKSAEMLAMRDNTEIKTYKVIYDLVDYVKGKIKEITPTEMIEMTIGLAKILRIFSNKKDKQIIGGRVEEGEIKSAGTVKIYRRDTLLGSGKIRELQVQKIKADLAKEGQEFGMMIESKIELAQGDILKATSLVRQNENSD